MTKKRDVLYRSCDHKIQMSVTPDKISISAQTFGWRLNNNSWNSRKYKSSSFVECIVQKLYFWWRHMKTIYSYDWLLITKFPPLKFNLPLMTRESLGISLFKEGSFISLYCTCVSFLLTFSLYCNKKSPLLFVLYFCSSEAAGVVRQVATAVAHLHSLNIAHRDLKVRGLCSLYVLYFSHTQCMTA